MRVGIAMLRPDRPSASATGKTKLAGEVPTPQSPTLLLSTHESTVNHTLRVSRLVVKVITKVRYLTSLCMISLL